jgi:hypothetical protein
MSQRPNVPIGFEAPATGFARAKAFHEGVCGAIVAAPKTGIGRGFGCLAHDMDTKGTQRGPHSMA